MPIDESYVQFIIDQLQNWRKITYRKMFGGAGLYSQGIMFALVYDDELFFRSTKDFSKKFTNNDSHQFIPPLKNNIKMPYWSVPEEIIEDDELLQEWAQDAFDQAQNAQKKKIKK